MAVSVAAAVKTIINRSPFISEMLIQEVISFSNLAKSIQPKVESLHGDKVNTAAIVMAIRRYAEELKASQKEIGSGKIDYEIQMKTNIYDVNFSYIDLEDMSEHYVSVPEQGGGKLIPEGLCNPGQVYTVSRGKSGMIGVFRLESQMLPGNGKLERTGLGSDRDAKESSNTAFNYLKANGNRISGSISTTQKDYIINYQDLQGIGMTGKLALHMPHGLKYKKRGKILCPTKATNIPNRTSIHERPKEADGTRFGDWEMDTIIDSCGHAIVTLTERSTNFILMEKLPQGRKALPTARAVIRLLFPYRQTIHTITTDNGCEFAAHQEITKQLSLKGRPPVKVYFTDAYSAWQKGAIENANKLIRKYIPKKANFQDFSDWKIKEIQKKLNRRPREKLNFDSPKYRFFINVL